MVYFTNAFTTFFKKLAKNNNTEWFNENRKIYETEVKKPFQSFVEEMIKRIKKHEPGIAIKPADAIMRINKDIRFSKDKIPYNTHVAANISAFGKKDKSYPGFYFQLGGDRIMVVGGSYILEPDQLKKVRTYIAKNEKAFNAAINDSNFIDKFGEVKGEKSKRLDEEFQKIAEKQPLIANKQFYYEAELKPALIDTPNLADSLMDYYTAGKKLNDFLKKALA
jgi:uncharacterized protein (TIGR02453 family)